MSVEELDERSVAALLLELVAQGEKPTDLDGLPADIVRFTLEFATKPVLKTVRVQLEQMLGGAGFELKAFDRQTPSFLILQFPGAKRTIAPPRLFAMADYLVNQLGLVSCVPDIGSTVYAEPDARVLRDGAPESAITDAFCWSDALPPADKHWAVNAVRSQKAWSLPNSRGEGVLVAQPDTGVASHPELEQDSLALELAANILEGGSDPTDPLKADTANPGHGTATSSVVVSRKVGSLIGSAPAARVVPIRCIEDVKIFDGAPVARAILHAVSIKADVISMSLGGIFSPSISVALEKAIAKGIIVVVASGNCVGFVVYPASDHRSIALAGTDVADKPWKGTSRGSQVDVSAPAENVYVARRVAGDDGKGTVSGGQGTSFATALTAGVAATWISRFGRAKIRRAAKDRNTSVQELFRAALKATARRPADWNSRFYGAGIVDAEALLKLPLADIPAAAQIETAATPQASAEEEDVATIFNLSASRREVEGFDWARYGAEATFLAADAFRRSDEKKAGLVESRIRPKPSPGFARHAPTVITRTLDRARAAPNLISPLERANAIRDPIRILGRRAGQLESSLPESIHHLSGRGLTELQDLAQRTFTNLDAQLGATAEAKAARREVLENSERIIKTLLTDGPSHIQGIDRADLEALVRLKGRPAFKITDGKLDKDAVEAGDWDGHFFIAPAQIKKLSEQVGRIDLDGDHVGTGFVVGEGLVMTNRHVAEAIADEVRTRTRLTWALQPGVTINFDDKGLGAKKRFRVKSIFASGPDTIGREVDFQHLDLAVLEVETRNNSCESLPPAVQLLENREESESPIEVIVVGYPARPDISALKDPKTQEVSAEIVQRLQQIFALDYGRKYLAPGRIDLIPGKIAGDPTRWVFAHDSTTLGGNSGSLVSKLTDHLPVVGLHFAGRTLTANYAHSLAAVKSAKKLPEQAIVRLSWKK